MSVSDCLDNSFNLKFDNINKYYQLISYCHILPYALTMLKYFPLCLSTRTENGPETQSLFNCKINSGLFDEMKFEIAP